MFSILSSSARTGMKPVGLFGMFMMRSFVFGEMFSTRKFTSSRQPQLVTSSGHLMTVQPSARGSS